MIEDPQQFQGGDKSWGVKGPYSGVSLDKEGPVEDEGPTDEDIIELVDVVREGEPPVADTNDLSLFLAHEQGDVEKEDVQEMEGEDSEGFSLPIGDASAGDLAPHLDTLDVASPEDAYEPPDFDFETPDGFESTGETASDISDDDLDLAMAGLVNEEDEGTSPPSETPDEAPPPFSQERLEAAIAEMVLPVVERVVRETVAEVAERVITEAIEGLRQSLDTMPE